MMFGFRYFRPAVLCSSALALAVSVGGGAEAPVAPPEIPFTSAPLPVVTSWIGNSYGGAKKWVQQDIAAMAVMPDGTVFTNVPWEEGGGNAGEYRDGELIRYGKYTHGWGNNGGVAVGANGRYVYLGLQVSNENGNLDDLGTWPPKGSKWYGISRRLRDDIGKGAPFSGGKGGKGATLPESFLPVATVPDTVKGDLSGLCVDEQRLYVADPFASEIKVYDAETMQPITQWKVRRTGPLSLDRDGVIWMLEKPTNTDPAPARLIRYTSAGQQVGDAFVFVQGKKPVAFAFAKDGRLLLADDGPAQIIRIYRVQPNDLVEEGTFGELGGIAAGTPGAFADRKLNRVVALGCDEQDHLYIAHNGQSGGGGTVLESYRLADGHLNWRLLGLTFVDAADFDPADDTEIFTKEERFHMDYAQPPGKEFRYQGFTIDREKYPQDPRLHLWSAGAWVRRIEGQRILFVGDMNSQNLQVYRFSTPSDGEVAIPSGLIAPRRIKTDTGWPLHQPEKGTWIWRDSNGNGAFDAGEYLAPTDSAEIPRAQALWVDEYGGLWQGTEKQGIYYYPCQGLDDHGNPCWEDASRQIFPHPEGFREVKRLRYDSATDTLYIGGTTEELKNQHWKPMGPLLARYDGWLRGARQQRWRVELPYVAGSSGHESCEPMGFDLAGDYLFIPYTGASKKNQIRTGRVEVFRMEDGSNIGHVEPGPEVGEIGLQDIRECLTAHRRLDGEYLVMIEDDYKAKVVLYRFPAGALPQ